MTLRTRIAAVASVSVALAVLAAAIGLYVAVRSDLRGEIDSALRARARAFVAPPAQGPAQPEAAGANAGASANAKAGAGAAALGPGAEPPGGGQRDLGAGAPRGGARAGGGADTALDGAAGAAPAGAGGAAPDGAGGAAPDGAGGRGGFPGSVQPAPFGAASGYVQLVGAHGSVFVPGGQGSSPTKIAPNASDLAIAKEGAGGTLSDRSVKGTELRVLTEGTRGGGAVMIARPLTEVEHELSRLLLILALIGGGGIVLAALLGTLVARTALAPVATFTASTETLSGNLDLSRRLEVHGRDELARLAHSFNGMLDALERSVGAQRQLIADASHELRTPMSSLRANIQILGEADRLGAEEQKSLRGDIVEELDELTALVGDVVELARGAAQDSRAEDVRLDEVVQAAVQSARRRGELRFDLTVEPTIVCGQGDRIARAVSNLVDNARKWSPPDGAVEVRLGDGVLSVRDHGPGFAETDLPFVFDRFYRAHDARKLPGSGLGLAIVRQAAEACGGFAEARNAPGGGALLRVGFGSPIVVPPAART